MIGYLGCKDTIIFNVSDRSILTPKGINHSAGADWDETSIISNKPRKQYIRPKIQTLSFSIELNIGCGVKPRDMLDKLIALAESSEVFPVIIGGKPLSKNNFVLVDISDTWNVVYNGGELASVSVSLSLEEYV